MAYITLNASYSSDLILSGGNTYYMFQTVDMQGYSVEFNQAAGNIVIKRNGNVSFTNVNSFRSVIPEGVSYHVYYTVKDDNSVGDTIDGATGSPAPIGGMLCSTDVVLDVSLKYWEIRYANDVPFIHATSINVTKSICCVDWKYCTYSAVDVVAFYQSTTDIYGTGKISDWTFDATNSLLNTARLLVTYNRSDAPKRIYVEYTNTHTNVIDFGICRWLDNPEDIRVKNLGGYGVLANWQNHTGLAWNRCSFSMFILGNTNALPVEFTNCIFDDNVSGWGNYAVFSRDVIIVNAVYRLNFRRCIFNNCNPSGAIFNNVEESAKKTYLNFYDCIFSNNYAILAYASDGHQLAWNCGWWNNQIEDYVYHGTAPIYDNPKFKTSKLVGCTLENNTYIPDGYLVTNFPAYEKKGSDTFDNLGVIEQNYSSTGYRYNGTDYITPGIQYYIKLFKVVSTVISGYNYLAFFRNNPFVESILYVQYGEPESIEISALITRRSKKSFGVPRGDEKAQTYNYEIVIKKEDVRTVLEMKDKATIIDYKGNSKTVVVCEILYHDYHVWRIGAN